MHQKTTDRRDLQSYRGSNEFYKDCTCCGFSDFRNLQDYQAHSDLTETDPTKRPHLPQNTDRKSPYAKDFCDKFYENIKN